MESLTRVSDLAGESVSGNSVNFLALGARLPVRSQSQVKSSFSGCIGERKRTNLSSCAFYSQDIQSGMSSEGAREDMDWSQTMGWFLLVGASGAGINALATGERRFWPVRASSSKGSPISHLGLMSHLAIGMAAGVVCTVACGVANTPGSASGPSPQQIVAVLPLALVLSRWATAETDKRLLRAAATKACQAPAAHPDTIRAMEDQTPQGVFAVCEGLAPGLAVWPSEVRHRQEEVAFR